MLKNDTKIQSELSVREVLMVLISEGTVANLKFLSVITFVRSVIQSIINLAYIFSRYVETCKNMQCEIRTATLVCKHE